MVPMPPIISLMTLLPIMFCYRWCQNVGNDDNSDTDSDSHKYIANHVTC